MGWFIIICILIRFSAWLSTSCGPSWSRRCRIYIVSASATGPRSACGNGGCRPVERSHSYGAALCRFGIFIEWFGWPSLGCRGGSGLSCVGWGLRFLGTSFPLDWKQCNWLSWCCFLSPGWRWTPLSPRTCCTSSNDHLERYRHRDLRPFRIHTSPSSYHSHWSLAW